MATVLTVAEEAKGLISVERVRTSGREKMAGAWVVRDERMVPEPVPTSRTSGVGERARIGQKREERKDVCAGQDSVSRRRYVSSEGG